MSKMVAVEKEIAVMEICPPRGRQVTSVRGKITVGQHSYDLGRGMLGVRAFFARFRPCVLERGAVQPGRAKRALLVYKEARNGQRLFYR